MLFLKAIEDHTFSEIAIEVSIKGRLKIEFFLENLKPPEDVKISLIWLFKRPTFHRCEVSWTMGVARILVSGVEHFRGSGSWGVRGAEPPPPGAGEFSKILKRFLKKIAKIHYFSMFSRQFNKPCADFSRVWTKNNKLLGNFEKIFEFFSKMRKYVILAYFSKN